MPDIQPFYRTVESEAVKTVAGLMALSARTAPKVVKLESIKIEILTGKDLEKHANQMIKRAKELKMDFSGSIGNR
jgi:uncharacterized ferredoxin-like protein